MQSRHHAMEAVGGRSVRAPSTIPTKSSNSFSGQVPAGDRDVEYQVAIRTFSTADNGDSRRQLPGVAPASNGARLEPACAGSAFGRKVSAQDAAADATCRRSVPPSVPPALDTGTPLSSRRLIVSVRHQWGSIRATRRQTMRRGVTERSDEVSRRTELDATQVTAGSDKDR